MEIELRRSGARRYRCSLFIADVGQEPLGIDSTGAGCRCAANHGSILKGTHPQAAGQHRHRLMPFSRRPVRAHQYSHVPGESALQGRLYFWWNSVDPWSQPQRSLARSPSLEFAARRVWSAAVNDGTGRSLLGSHPSHRGPSARRQPAASASTRAASSTSSATGATNQGVIYSAGERTITGGQDEFWQPRRVRSRIRIHTQAGRARSRRSIRRGSFRCRERPARARERSCSACSHRTMSRETVRSTCRGCR